MDVPEEHPGAPEQIEPKGTADYLEVMSRAIFQTGISWRVVQKKWPGIREAFQGFDPVALAQMGDPEIEALMQDARVIRNRPKLRAIVENARRMLDVADQHGSFAAYLRSLGDFQAKVKDLRKRFGFMGDTGAYYFLYVVREPVPTYDEWCASRGR